MIKCVGYGEKNKGKVKYYVGYTGNSPHKRLMQHKTGHGGSKWMQRYKMRPKYITYLESIDSKEEAKDRERQVKNWSHEKKKERAGSI